MLFLLYSPSSPHLSESGKMQLGFALSQAFFPLLAVTDPFNAEANPFFLTIFAFWKFAVVYEYNRRTLMTAT